MRRDHRFKMRIIPAEIKKILKPVTAGLIACFIICGLPAREKCFAGGNMKKAVMIIAANQFKEEELFEPKAILEQAGIGVTVASTTLNNAAGTAGRVVKPQLLVRDIAAGDFDAVIFVGGGGAEQYWNDHAAHALADEAYKKGKIVAAICIAPVTLARAGILRGKRATVFYSEAALLSAAGAKYTGSNVEKDGNIITASGPAAAREFGEELVKAILY